MALYSTDFSSYSNDVPPSDWTPIWDITNSNWNVRVKSGTLGGKVLEHTASASARRAIRWDHTGTNLTDIIVKAKVRTSSKTTLQNGVGARIQGSPGSAQTAYVAEISDGSFGQFMLGKYVNSAFTELGRTSAKTWSINEFWWIKIETVGTTIRAKYWLDGASEPGAWDISVTDSSITTGSAGLFCNTFTGVRDFDFFSVETPYNVQFSVNVNATSSLTKPGIPESELKQNALSLTSLFETSTAFPDNFGVTAGNFDGQGISHGAIQFNFGSGTLQPIWSYLINNFPSVVQTAIPNTDDYDEFVDVVLNRTQVDQVAWGESISNPSNKHLIIEPWKTYFHDLGVSQESIDRQTLASESYQTLAKNWFNEFGLFTRRGYALLFDIAVQSGGISQTVKDLIFADFANIDTTGKTPEQIETEEMVIIANRRSDAVSEEFRESYRDRKLAIAYGSGWVYDDTLFMDTAVYNMILEPAFGSALVALDVVKGMSSTVNLLTTVDARLSGPVPVSSIVDVISGLGPSGLTVEASGEQLLYGLTQSLSNVTALMSIGKDSEWNEVKIDNSVWRRVIL